MKSWRLWALAVTGTPLAVLMAMGGCSRSLSVSPTVKSALTTATFTSTRTITSTSTSSSTTTATFTSTATPSATGTWTSIYSLTWTNSPTPSYTATPTYTATSTDTFPPGFTPPTSTDTPTTTDTPTATLTVTATPTWSGTPTYSPTSTNTPNTSLIDNLEDGDGQINTSLAGVNATTAGYWFTSGDSGCTLNPVPNTTVAPVAISDGPLGGNTWVFQVTGSGCNSYGGGAGLNFLNPVAGMDQPYNAQAQGFTGVRFDIRQVSGTSVSSVRFGVLSYGTVPTTVGGGCDNSGGKCNDNFGADLTISTAWKAVTLYFTTDMHQQGWGTAATFDLTQLYGLQWQLNDATGASLGMQVDNVSFISSTPPPTATPNSKLIDDLEDGDGVINKVCAGVTNPPGAGSWFTYSDGTGCTLNPAEGGTFTPISITDGPAGGSTWVAQMTGSGCTTFGGLGFNFLQPDASKNKQAYNLQNVMDSNGITGVRFDIRATAGSSDGKVRFSIPCDMTEPTTDGGACDNSGNKCNDHFGANIAITTAWQPVTEYFTTAYLKQQGWGQATVFDTTAVYGMQWQVNAATAGSPIGLQVDNVNFVTSAVPPTPTPDCHPIDDMEDDDNQIDTVCGRGGYWYAYSDGGLTSEKWDTVIYTGISTTGSICWPTVDGCPSAPQSFIMSGPGYGGSNWCARITGITGTAGSYAYGGMGCDLTSPQGPFDISNGGMFTGVQYVARANPGAYFYLMIPTTEVKDNGNYQMSHLPADNNWHVYNDTFTSMSQPSWAVVEPWNPQHAIALHWQTNAQGFSFDISVDDIVLIP